MLAVDTSIYSEAAAQALVLQARPEYMELCVFHVVVPLVIIAYNFGPCNCHHCEG